MIMQKGEREREAPGIRTRGMIVWNLRFDDLRRQSLPTPKEDIVYGIQILALTYVIGQAVRLVNFFGTWYLFSCFF